MTSKHKVGSVETSIDGTSFSNLGPARIPINHGLYYMNTQVHIRDKGGEFMVTDFIKGRQPIERVFPKGSKAECRTCLGGVQLHDSNISWPKCLILGHKMTSSVWAICTRYKS